MGTERIDVRHVAKLARLALSDDEVEQYGTQLAGLLTFVDELAELATDHIAATAQVIELRNVARPDAVSPGLSRDDVLGSAPQAQFGSFRVPKIIAGS